MSEVLSPGTLLKDTYMLKKSLYTGRFYNFYLAEDTHSHGTMYQITEFLISKIPVREHLTSEEELDVAKELLKEIKNPLLPEVTDTFSNNGNDYLVLTYTDGINLQSYMDMNISPFNPEDAIAWAIKLTRSLMAIYNRPTPLPFIHIDPCHINVSATGEMSLMGFGLQLMLDHYLSSPEPDAFCAPEIIEGKPFTVQSAIYSIGALLYYMVTKRKWDSRKKDNPSPRSISKTVPDELQEIILKCLSKGPEHRFLDLESLSTKLDQVIHPPAKEELKSAGVTEKLFVKESAVIIKKMKLVGYAMIALFLLAVMGFSIYGHILRGKLFTDSQFASVLTEERNSIDFIDIKAGARKKVISLAGEAVSMTFSHNGKKLYVARESKSIEVVDIARLSDVGTYALENTPGTILITPDDKLAFVSSQDAPLVTVWDPVTYEVKSEITIGDTQKSAAMSPDPDGKSIYLLGKEKEEISVIDTAKKAYVTSWPAGKKPTECLVSKTGRYVVVPSLEDAVYFFEAQYATLARSVPLAKGLKHGAAPPGTGKNDFVYIASEDESTISLVDCSTFAVLKTARTKGTPVDLKVSPDGETLYVLCSSPNAFNILDARSLRQKKEIYFSVLRPSMLEVWPQAPPKK